MNCLRALGPWDRGFESHSSHGYLCVFILCLGSDFATGWSLVQGVLPSVKNDYGTEQEAWALNGLEEPFKNYIGSVPITAAARSKAWTVFARSNAGIADSNPTEGMDICVCVVLCVGRGLATDWSPVYRIKKLKKTAKAQQRAVEP
jgi:hypothetical protein